LLAKKPLLYNQDKYSIKRFMGHIKHSLSNNNNYDSCTDFSAQEIIYKTEYQIKQDGIDQVKDQSFVSVIDLIAKHAASSPHKAAVVFGNESISFLDLEHETNQLAHYLRSKGVQEETMVPIMMERSLEMIVGILGILKAGGAYVPIDPQFPKERIDLILKETLASLLLTHRNSQSKTIGLAAPVDVVKWEDIQPQLALQSKAQPTANLAPHHLAYVLFTSGSTGKPKGVLVEHAALASSTISRNAYYNRLSNIILVPSYTFDASVGAIFGSLSQGGCLFVPSQDELQDPDKLAKILRHIDTLLCVPSYYAFLLDEGLIENARLSKIILGGENLSRELVSRHFALPNNIQLFNEYGPTEATVWATVEEIKLGNLPITIGLPIQSAAVYILDSSGRLVPDGTVGELYIAGQGLARGYLHDDQLTRQRFIENPVEPHSKAYKTGDLAYRLPDGRLVYRGRLDEQVKINGHRIELGEIESVLSQNEKVKQAIVLPKKHENGEEKLVVFYIPYPFAEEEHLREYLLAKLPAYMVPNIWVSIEKFPLSPNGKIDKQALHDLDVHEHLTRNYESPRNQTEQIVLDHWEKLLRIGRIGIHDNFFELGGNSLTAMRLVSGLRRQCSFQISLEDLFSHPTVAELSSQMLLNSPEGDIGMLDAPKLMTSDALLSYSQESLWFIDQLEGTVSYHLPIAFKIDGQPDIDALTRSLKSLLERHEVLKSAVVEKEGRRYSSPLPVDQWSLHLLDGQRSDEELQKQLEAFLNAPFDLARDFMLRATLIKISPSEHILLLVIHHIAFDAWSRTVLIKELFSFYKAYHNGGHAELPNLPIKYADYAIWQRDRYEKSGEGKLGYWKNKLDDLTPLQLPKDFNPNTASKAGAVKQFLIPSLMMERLKRLSTERGATLFMTLLAGFKTLLYRYSGQEDICVGTAIAGREEPETEHMIGYFVNSLALRTKVNGKASFLDLLDGVKTTTLEAYGHKEVPFERVAAELRAQGKDQNPLFQVMFNYHNVPQPAEVSIEGLHLSPLDIQQNHSKFDLTFSLSDSAKGLKGIVEYRTDLYHSNRIQNMINHYLQLLQSLLIDPSLNVGKMNMLAPEEKHHLLTISTPHLQPCPTDKTIVDLFEEQASKTPHGVALIFGTQKITYKELNERSNQLAHLLRSKGVKEETLVLLCIERSVEMVVGMFGILKAGGAYVPIDPLYPQDRIDFIQQDTVARLAVSSTGSREKLTRHDELEVILLDPIWSNIQHLPVTKAENHLQQNHLSYIIYTSGSTGQPKGVMIEHKNVFSFICWCREEFNAEKFEMVYASTSVCFDLSIFEIFYPLSIGKPIRLLENGLEINEYLSLDSSVMINTVPSVMDHLLEEGLDHSKVSTINMAGEPIPQKVLRKSDPENVEIRNLYGPTEDTTYSTVYRIQKGRPLLIGKPISNTSIYILSPENELTPMGVPGEICIAGSGLSRGYLNREDLTREKFLPHPFAENPADKIYRTGDIGRWVEDGQIEYLGRMDDQVKVRGFRIELGEIEKVLQLMEGVQHAVVLAEDDHQGNKQLVGYLTYEGNFESSRVMEFLRQKLPAFMVPSRWVSVNEMPLTPNGKINKKALSRLDSEESFEGGYGAPRTQAEKMLVLLWENLLQVQPVGIHDDFFRKGGHSLLVTSLVSSIRTQFEVNLGIKDVFQYPTIAGLTTHFDFKIKSSDPVFIPEKLLRPEQIEVSYNQESLWFIDKLNGSTQYHIPKVLKFSGVVEDARIAQVLNTILERHEALRTVIRNVNGQLVQLVKDPSRWSVSTIEGGKFKNKPEDLQKYIFEEVQKPFNLAEDYMFRATLIHLDPQNHLLVLVFHHIASDGWSVSLLLKELATLLHAYEDQRDPNLPALPIQYADFSLWQRKHLQEESLVSQTDYWKRKLASLQPLQLPLDYSRPAVQSVRGATRTFTIDRELADQLLVLGQGQGSTLFMTLLAAFKVMLYRYSSQEDICVGTVTAGRQTQDTDKLIGYFVNPLPIRSSVNAEASFLEVLEEVKNNCMDAFENQEVPFDKIVADSGISRDLGKNPLFQVMFILQNLPQVLPLSLNNVKITEEPIYQTTSKFDLSFIVTDDKYGLQGTVEYCTDLFKETSIDQMIQAYLSFLYLMVSNPSQKIKDPLFLFSKEGHKTQEKIQFSGKKKSQERMAKNVPPSLKTNRDKSAKTANEKLIASIWAEALGIKTIDIYDNFFEKGGHSLTAVQVMTRLEKQLGVKLPLSILFKYPTVHGLAGIIEKKNNKVKEWDSLVPIKPDGSNDPLYIIHGGGSNILSFYDIAKNMAAEQPVYGLQPKGLNGKEMPLITVEAIASHFIAEIIRQNPNGPYCLAGYSFGGIIAYEMARQLKASNREVKHLIMFDTIAYQTDKGQTWIKRLHHRITHEIGKRWFDATLLYKYPQTLKKLKVNSLRHKFSSLKILLKLEKEKPISPILKAIEDIHKEAARKYVLKPYDGPIHLMKAKIPTYYIADPKNLGWKTYVREIHIKEMEGEHTTMFAPPHDVDFAGVLQEILTG